MKFHASTLFAIGADGRLRYVQEPGDPYPPPRFFMGRTLQGNVWHLRHDLPDELAQELERLCRSEPVAGDFMQPPHLHTPIRAALQAHAPITQEERGPAYRIPASVTVPSNAVRITKRNGHLLKDAFPWLWRRIQAGVEVGPVVSVAEQGTTVSTCYCARLSPSAAEAGVVTLETMRRKGYATAAVAGWTAACVECGLQPLYSTSWQNPGSLRVAQKLGMVCYGEDWSIE
jgi:hypothetical protein